MAELADAQDLKSCGTYLPYRFDSGRRHYSEKLQALVFQGFEAFLSLTNRVLTGVNVSDWGVFAVSFKWALTKDNTPDDANFLLFVFCLNTSYL